MLPEFIKYYYNRLSEQGKKVYLQMYNSFRAHQRSINITVDPSLISPDDLLYIFECLYYDTPSFYFLSLSNGLWVSKAAYGYVLRMQYQYTEDEIAQYDRKLVSGLQNFKTQYIRYDMTAYEKEIAIHDYLVSTVKYDYESRDPSEKMTCHGDQYNVLGPLLRKKAVCQGIASAFKLICDYCGIKCFVIRGSVCNPEQSLTNHAWNIVRLERENYHVDVTWDLKERGDISFVYDYMNLNDALMHLDHSWDDRDIPHCQSLEYNYYRRNHLYVKSLEEISDFVYKSIRSGNRYITFKYIGEMPSEPDLEKALLKGVQHSGIQQPFCIAANRETHNVYLDLALKP